MDIFNNRELASATLIILLFSWASYKSKDVISGLTLVVKSLFKKAIIITIISLALYISIIVYGLHIIDVWNTGQIKNTVLWFTFVGFVQLLNTTNIKDPSLYLKTSLKDQVKIIVLVQFLVAFHSFNYFAELFLLTVISLLACCNVVSQNKPEYKQAKKLCEYLLAIIGILAFSYSLFIIYQESGKFFSINNLRNFIVPMLLSVALLPYTYCFYYFLAYERAFVKTHIYTSSPHLQRYAKIESFIAFRGKVDLIHQWLLHTCTSEFESKETIRRSIYAFKQSTVS
ncbi:hypothetical protein [Pseudoalteromonas sp. SWYJZ12]|uniref:hypothetical protein n=1 Tax=Pseudoalteromonas sp. SWYJZ12 TaxID=2792067 RepID=UPI0018CD4F8B|nr:hypothetical protein [Pseudoalteromonas sp. SWYJZ12]MBH0004813.1 hypothetical protein [Pseudoalteromonas sp. SWYJZ12]